MHRLDPRTKILLSVLFIVAVFVVANPISFILLTSITLCLIAVSGISFKVVFKGIKPIIFVLIFTALINIFMTVGDSEPLVSFWVINIYTEGIVRAVFMSARVVLLIVGSSMLLTYTTSPISLTDGLESLLSPLKKIGVPVHVFAMMMTIALRFIPTLIEETEKIMNAQKSRGADFTSGGLVKRVKALIPLLVPLFLSSFKRAEELATAMECRCYRGDKNRTKLIKLTYRTSDYLWLLMGAIVTALIFVLRYVPYNLSLEGIIFDIFLYRL